MNFYDYNKVAANDKAFAEIALQAIKNEGYIIFKNFPIAGELSAVKKHLEEKCNLIATPISHDANNAIVWDIKSNPKSGSFVKTYSEHSHEAELHTDSQYSSYPEDMFVLLSLVKADCGGGLSSFLSLKKILEELNKLENGAEVIATFSNTDYPFIVPNVFKKTQTEAFEFNYGPILRPNEIRFRIDTFEKALKIKHDYCTADQMTAYYALKNIVQNKDIITNYMLQPGELLVINNKTMLHGREAFEDAKRHLLRIRMNFNHRNKYHN